MSRDLTGRRPGRADARGDGRADTIVAVERALTRVVRLARPRLHRPALESAGGPTIDPAAYATLHWVAAEPNCRLTELADVLSVDISTASRQVASLEAAGLVERHADPADQRSRRLALSPAGVELLDRTRQARVHGLSGLLGDWSGEDIETLARLLDRLALSLAGEGSPS